MCLPFVVVAAIEVGEMAKANTAGAKIVAKYNDVTRQKATTTLLAKFNTWYLSMEPIHEALYGNNCNCRLLE
jgi:hypothetical protein